mmetsp:Transcript_11257/g.48643  ORF Transcript_11257/g.48643 Transcript_11257/m.48643 type:complete len:204 (+) Transcript_11257:743-1354(+)
MTGRAPTGKGPRRGVGKSHDGGDAVKEEKTGATTTLVSVGASLSCSESPRRNGGGGSDVECATQEYGNEENGFMAIRLTAGATRAWACRTTITTTGTTPRSTPTPGRISTGGRTFPTGTSLALRSRAWGSSPTARRSTPRGSPDGPSTYPSVDPPCCSCPRWLLSFPSRCGGVSRLFNAWTLRFAPSPRCLTSLASDRTCTSG